MGDIWLLDLPDACRSGGLDVVEYDGWETRSRSSGGYDKLIGVGYHHDASAIGSTGGDDYGWLYADDRPIGAMRLHRDGVLVVGAAGATNTMGKGGPVTGSTGTCPLDKGNQHLIAIEAANNGVGEPWPAVQVDAYVALVAALIRWYDLDPGDCWSHWQYCEASCPGRKIDPAGPTPSRPEIGGTGGASTWSTTAFRSAVAEWTSPHPEPEPPTEEEDDRMLFAVRLNTNTNLVVIGDGISCRRIRADETDDLETALTNGTGPAYHDPTKPDRPVIRDIWKLPTVSDDYIQLLGIETTESLNQPG